MVHPAPPHHRAGYPVRECIRQLLLQAHRLGGCSSNNNTSRSDSSSQSPNLDQSVQLLPASVVAIMPKKNRSTAPPSRAEQRATLVVLARRDPPTVILTFVATAQPNHNITMVRCSSSLQRPVPQRNWPARVEVCSSNMYKQYRVQNTLSMVTPRQMQPGFRCRHRWGHNIATEKATWRTLACGVWLRCGCSTIVLPQHNVSSP